MIYSALKSKASGRNRLEFGSSTPTWMSSPPHHVAFLPLKSSVRVVTVITKTRKHDTWIAEQKSPAIRGKTSRTDAKRHIKVVVKCWIPFPWGRLMNIRWCWYVGFASKFTSGWWAGVRSLRSWKIIFRTKKMEVALQIFHFGLQFEGPS